MVWVHEKLSNSQLLPPVLSLPYIIIGYPVFISLQMNKQEENSCVHTLCSFQFKQVRFLIAFWIKHEHRKWTELACNSNQMLFPDNIIIWPYYMIFNTSVGSQKYDLYAKCKYLCVLRFFYQIFIHPSMVS